jgi:hypothetical protein
MNIEAKSCACEDKIRQVSIVYFDKQKSASTYAHQHASHEKTKNKNM